MYDPRRYCYGRERAGMHLAKDRGTQRMRRQPGRFAVANQNVRTHRVLNRWTNARQIYHLAALDRSETLRERDNEI